jgi:hypothetical protein
MSLDGVVMGERGRGRGREDRDRSGDLEIPNAENSFSFRVSTISWYSIDRNVNVELVKLQRKTGALTTVRHGRVDRSDFRTFGWEGFR